jgi:hypothetical protein
MPRRARLSRYDHERWTDRLLGVVSTPGGSDIPARIVEIDDAQSLEGQLVELSIVGNNFLCENEGRSWG